MRAIANVQGIRSWEFRVIGDVPPGVPPELVSQIVLSGFAVICGTAPQVRWQTVTVHEMDHHALKAKIEAEQGKSSLTI